MSKQTKNNILKKLREISDKDTHTILHDFFIMSACAVRNSFDHRNVEKYEERYKALARSYKPEQLKVMSEALAMLKLEYESMLNGDCDFTDLIGELYMDSATSNDKSGQFFTPYSISRASAEATFNDDEIKATLEEDPNHVFTILEPSCGSGGMVVAAMDALGKKGVNYAWNAFADCTDIDERCVCMCFIQLSFLGIPAIIHHGNALTLEMHDEWHTPAYILSYLHFSHRIKGNQAPIENRSTHEIPVEPKESETTNKEKLTNEPVQLSLF